MLELQGIEAGYDGHTVLRSIDLVVPDGAVVALLGPNGAGKTTLLRVACGLLAPSRGQVLLDGEDVTNSSPDRRARQGIVHVPEGRAIFPTLTVRDNLRLQAPPGSAPAAIATAGAVFPRLRERSDQIAGTLSGGEQQMLAMAVTHLAPSRVVLLDEVSMGLAPKIVDEIYGFLHELAQRETALLLVEQYVQRALALADYVYVLSRGQVRFFGEPAELTDDRLHAAYLGVAV